MKVITVGKPNIAKAVKVISEVFSSMSQEEIDHLEKIYQQKKNIQEQLMVG